jgi:FkbM family methyltransferase
MTHNAENPSQFGQTDFVLKSLSGRTNGYFVELGADDGVQTSNTLLLERSFGWSGICIEPVANRYQLLKQNRRCQTDPRCVSGVSGERVVFKVDRSATVFSGITDYMSTYRDRSGDTIELVTVTLTEVLNDHNAPSVIDYLSLDTEGSEFQILSGCDMTRYRFRVITVEHNHEETKRRKIRELLQLHGYAHIATIGVDDCYFHRQLMPWTIRLKLQSVWKPKAALSWIRKTIGLRTRIRRMFSRQD